MSGGRPQLGSARGGLWVLCLRMGEALKLRRMATRTAGAGLALGLALVLGGCQEQIFGRVYAEGEIDIADDLYAVTAVGPDRLWTAGYFGAIYRTTDGGESWQKLDSGTRKSIYDISFADAENGWAVGRRGFIIHTTDGGDTWERQRGPRQPPRHIFAVQAIDATTAWAVGDWGSRYLTRDAGKTWQDRSFLVNEKSPVFPYLTDEELEVFNSGGKVYDDVYLNDVFFLDDKHGWIAAEYGLIFVTEDGGETWEKAKIQGEVSFDPVNFPKLEGSVPRELWDTLFEVAERLVEYQHLRLRIEGYLTPAEYKATGDTTLADERAQSVRDFLEGEGVTQDRIKLVNSTPFDQEGVDMDAFEKSKMRDRAQVDLRVIETPFLFDIKFRDLQHGAIAGLGGVILMSDDGGWTWNYRDSTARQALFGIGFGSEALFVVGEKGLHRHSLDGGRSWSKPQPDFQTSHEMFGFMRDLIFPTPERGWIVGRGSFVLRSDDGGMSWQKIDPLQRSRISETAAGE